MKLLFLGSYRPDYSLPKICINEGDTISYIGLSKKYIEENRIEILDWTHIIIGNIPQEWKCAFDILYIDSLDSILLSSGLPSVSKVNTIFRIMMKETGIFLFREGLCLSSMDSYIKTYLKTVTSSDGIYSGWNIYSTRSINNTPISQKFIDANGVKYTRGMAPEVLCIRESLCKPTIAHKELKEMTYSKYSPRIFTNHNSIRCGRSVSIERVTIDHLKKEIERDDFIERYISNLRELYSHKIDIYSSKYNELFEEYEATRRIVEKLTASKISRKTLKELYPFYDEYTSYLFQLEDMISSFGKYTFDKDEIRSRLKKIFEVFDGVLAREEVKEQLIRLIYSFSRNWRYVTDTFLNYAIMGPSGVGKTTIAKVIGKVLNLSGILITDRSHIVTRCDMIGKYVGQTSPLVRRILFSSLEGVLIIDEAYALAFGKEYNSEAISEIVNFLDKYIGLSGVIVLGYEDKMKELFDINEGMNRRFPMKIVLEKYTNSQLTNILISIILSKGIVVCEEVGNYLYDYVCSEDFPHQAGDILNLASKIVTGIYTCYNIEWGDNPVTDLEILCDTLQ